MFGSEARQESREVGRQVERFCANLDPNTVGMADVPAVFDELAAMKKRIDGALVRMTARYEETGAWKRHGAKDVEDDVARKTGTSRSAARRTAKTSRRVRNQPKTDRALREGKLSTDQAEAVSSGADASPEDEDDLLDSAERDPLHATREKAAQARAKADTDREARRRRQHKLRGLRRWIDEDGMCNHLLRSVPEVGAEIDATLKPLIDRAFADARDAGRMEDLDAYAADVVADLLRGRLTAPGRPTTQRTTSDSADAADAGVPRGADDAPDNATPDDASDDGERLPARSMNQAVRPDRKVLAFIDVTALNRGHVEGAETCEIAGVGPVSVSAIRSMLSDSIVSIVIRDGVDVRNVTHLERNVTAHQRTALEARGYKCEVEGCGSTRHLDIDHVTGWTLTHETRLDDLSWLCNHDHDRKTRENLILVGPPGRRRLVPRDPDDPTVPAKPTQYSLAL